jgi:hypothetical protein
MDDIEQLAHELRGQRKTLEALLLLSRRDHAVPQTEVRRKNVLALLSQSLDTIRQNRNAWLRLDPAAKLDRPEITELLRENQNLILKILVLDKEKEETQRRSGQAPQRPETAASDPSPHWVSKLYRRNAAT